MNSHKLVLWVKNYNLINFILKLCLFSKSKYKLYMEFVNNKY